MKTQQRHHLKENELVHGLNVARDYLAPRGKQVGMIAGAIVLVLVLVLGFVAFRNRSNSAADVALAEALVALNARVVPPSDPDAADLPEAASLDNTGTFATEAAKLAVAIRSCRRPPTSIRMTRPASLPSTTWAEHWRRWDGTKRRSRRSATSRTARPRTASTAGWPGWALPIRRRAPDNWMLPSRRGRSWPTRRIRPAGRRHPARTGTAYAAKGNTAEARKVLTQLLDEHPTSPYLSDARTGARRIEGITLGPP